MDGFDVLDPIENVLTIEDDALRLWIVCSIVILASIFIHGLSTPRLLKMTPNKEYK